MSARLTALSHSTLSLALERQRLISLSSKLPQSSLAQIIKNLGTLRSGIIELESASAGDAVAARKLREGYDRIWSIVSGWEGLEGLRLEPPRPVTARTVSEPISPPPHVSISDPATTPYRDDDSNPEDHLEHQRQLMYHQDTHLDHLSSSIGRQRDISLQINSELDVHTGLLEELDVELDHTEGRLTGARRRLDRFSKGALDNCSTMSIGILIFLLLILIILFKT